MNIKEYDEIQQTASREKIASGDGPLARMKAPTLFATEAKSVYLVTDRAGKVSIMGAGVEAQESDVVRSLKGDLSGSGVVDLFRHTSLLDVCFVNRPSLLAAVKLVTASKRGTDQRDARVIKYLAEQPAIARCSVLTTALAQKFWTPNDESFRPDFVGSWSSAFGITGTSRLEAVLRLADKARAGSLDVLPTANFRTSSSNIANLLFRWSGAKNEAFSALQNHSDLWEAACGSDPLSYERGLVTGSTVRVVPVGRDGDAVLARVSTPFKLRPGNNITVFGGVMPKGLPVKLRELDFDNETGSLMARIERVAKRPKVGEADGFFFPL